MKIGKYLSIFFVLILAVVIISSTVELESTNEHGSSDLTCSEIQNVWSGRDGIDIVNAMQSEALDAEFAEDWVGAICILELASQKRTVNENPRIRNAIDRKLVNAYTKAKMHSEAEILLESILEDTEPSSTVLQVRRVSMLLQLARLAKEKGNIERQKRWLAQGREEQENIDVGNLFREELFLAEIELFESDGDYDMAISSASDLLHFRLKWAEAMPGENGKSRVDSARREYARLLWLGGYPEEAEAIQDQQ